MVCEEYLDVINVVVRDAYYYTYPRTVSAEVYIKSLGRHEAPPSYDEAWRRQVMERAFKRMVNKDKILVGKQFAWELHPDFEAKRFFKIRDSAEWVSQIYSTTTPQQHRSRVALQSLESFLNSELGPISGKQLIKLFGYSAGEGYDNWQNEDQKLVKSEPASELANPTRTTATAGTKRKRIDIEGNGSDEHNSTGSEPSSPIPLYTPRSSPPSLQSAGSSFEANQPLDTSATTQQEKVITEKPGQEARAATQSGITTFERPRQEVQVGAQPGRSLVDKSRRDTFGATQLEKSIPERSRHSLPADPRLGLTVENSNQQATAVEQSEGVAANIQSTERAELEILLSRYPWLASAPKKIQEKFPQDSFELVVSDRTLKFKCNDCPANLYKAVYPDRKICNFEAHLRTPLHRRTVAARLGGVTPVVGKSSPAPLRQRMNSFRVSGAAPITAQSSPGIPRRTFNSRSSDVQQPSPALQRPDANARPTRRVSTARQASMHDDLEEDSDQQSTNEGRSLVMIFPIRFLPNSAKSRPQSLLSETSQRSVNILASEDRTKRRRVVPEDYTYSANPHTVNARTWAANLDPRTKQCELLKANDKKIIKPHAENIIKRSEAYQSASSGGQPALEEQGRNEYVNARYAPRSGGSEDWLTHGRRKLGKDAESYAKSQAGYNRLTKEWGNLHESSSAAAKDMRGLGHVDISTRSHDGTAGEAQNAFEATSRNDFGAALGKFRISQATEGGATPGSEQKCVGARSGNQKARASDDDTQSRKNAAMNLKDQIGASAPSRPSDMSEKAASLSGLLSLLETRTEAQRQIFTAAHQLQVSTSEEVALLRTTSSRHDQELETFKSTTKREKKWRKYLDGLTKEHKTKIAQLEARVSREREDKQSYKMAMEGRVDAMIKHHQNSSDAVMKKMNALEKLVMEQSKQLVEQNKLIEMLTKRELAT